MLEADVPEREIEVDASVIAQVTELSEQSVADPNQATQGVLKLLIATASAQDGYLILATRRGAAARRSKDPLAGFRIQFHLRAIPPTPLVARLLAEIVQSAEYVEDPVVQAHHRRYGTLWLERAASFDEEAPSHRTPGLIALREALKQGDQLVGGIPLGPEAHFRVGIDRGIDQPPFDEASRRGVLDFMVAVAPILRRSAAWHGIYRGRVVLAPRECQIFRLLLGESSEKQIGGALGLTQRSTHQLVLATYRKLGVSSRAALFRRWLQLEPVVPPEPGIDAR
jgi:DNA-binding CsgD family transcriptional regulator